MNGDARAACSTPRATTLCFCPGTAPERATCSKSFNHGGPQGNIPTRSGLFPVMQIRLENTMLTKRPEDTGSHGNASQMPSTEQEMKLVREAQNGSSAAFARLVELYERRILLTTRKLTNNAEDARDAVQEAFLKSFKNLRRFNGDSRFSTWLTRIAINEARMLLRNRYRRRDTSLDDILEFGESSMRRELRDLRPDPEERLADDQMQMMVASRLSSLPAKAREILYLRYYKELPIADAARSLGLTNSAAKARLSRALMRLRSSMATSIAGETVVMPRPQRRVTGQVRRTSGSSRKERESLYGPFPPPSSTTAAAARPGLM